jgi:hypothetical protein
MAVVTQEKIEEVWGKCTTYKTTNVVLLPERRKELVELYAKIYGKPEVTNNEFMAWVVKGYIAEQMGCTVDWASAASSTSFTLASRVEGDLIRRDLTSEQLAQLQLLAPHVAPRTGGSGKKGAVGTPEQDLKPGVPPSGIGHVSDADLATIQEVLRVAEELLVASERKQQSLLASKKTMEEKVVVYKFGVEDRLADAKEAAENVLAAEEALVKIDLQIADVQASVMLPDSLPNAFPLHELVIYLVFYYIHTRNLKQQFPRLLLWVGVRMPFVILSRLWSSTAVSVIGWLKSTLILSLLMLLVAWTVLACSRITTWEFPNAVQTFAVGLKVTDLGTNLMSPNGIIFTIELPTKTLLITMWEFPNAVQTFTMGCVRSGEEKLSN